MPSWQSAGRQASSPRGEQLKAANAALFANIEKRYGVPPGPLLAIWGMETGFGTFTGNAEHAVGGRHARL